jgi:hypothetical protein
MPASHEETIPFTLGDNDKIYVKGRINGGQELDLQFDLGAGGSIIKKSAVSKARMQFDGTVRLRNSHGDNVVPSSSRNRLDVAGLSWDEVAFAVADNMTWRVRSAPARPDSDSGWTRVTPNYSVGRDEGDRAALGVLGNDVLKRFNLIIDNRSGAAYFRPNGRMQDRFRNPEYYVVRALALAVGTLAMLTIWLARRPGGRRCRPWQRLV